MEVQQKKRPNEDYVLMAEYRLLNALIHSKVYAEDSRVHENSFPHDLAKSFYKAIIELHETKVPITAAALHQKANELDYSATLDVANHIISVDSGASTIDDMISVLYKAKQKQNFLEQMHELTREASQKGDMDPAELMAKLYEAEQTLADVGDKQLLKSLDEWIETYLEDLSERSNVRRHLFGDPLLDDALVKGAYPGAITAIAGSTGQGKSTYVLNLINGMINQDIPCMYISLEMSEIDTMDRLMSMRCDIPTADLYNPDPEALEAIIRNVNREREKLKNSNLFYFVDEPDLSLVQVSQLIKEFKQRTKKDYVVVAIDLLTQLREFMAGGSGMNLAQSIERAMNKLNIVAKKENCHIIGVVQFNREADNIKLQEPDDVRLLRPTLNNIKNAQAIAERSRAVLGLFRPKYYIDRYLPDHAEYMDDVMEVQVLKQSNGSTPRIYYEYIGEVFAVIPYEPPADDEEKKTEEEKEAESKLNF